MSSIHLEADNGDIAETVLISGDPLRAKYVADTMLDDAKCYNQVRGMLGYTGYYNKKLVSVQGTGMGMGSTSIYVNELINTYGVKNIIRIGTCGAIQQNLKLGQVILAMGASGDSGRNVTQFEGMHFAATADFDLLMQAKKVSETLNIDAMVGSIFSTDSFYEDSTDRWDIWEQHGILAVEMESQILYTLAAKHRIRALSILTVSDNIKTGQTASHLDREQSFTDMSRIALELANTLSPAGGA